MNLKKKLLVCLFGAAATISTSIIGVCIWLIINNAIKTDEAQNAEIISVYVGLIMSCFMNFLLASQLIIQQVTSDDETLSTIV